MVRKNTFLRLILILGKLADFPSRTTAKKELFIVKGKSAMGSTKQGGGAMQADNTAPAGEDTERRVRGAQEDLLEQGSEGADICVGTGQDGVGAGRAGAAV